MRKRSIIIIITLAVFAFVLWFVKDPLLERIREHRFSSHIENAAIAFEKEDYIKATQLLGAAKRLRPGNLEAIKMLLPLAEEYQSSDLQALTLELFHHPEASNEDKLNAFDVALRQKNLFVCSIFLKELNEQLEADSFKSRKAEYLALTGNQLGALELFDTLDENQLEDKVKLSYASLLVQQIRNPIAQKEAVSLIEHLIANSKEVAQEAFYLLEKLNDKNYLQMDFNLLEDWLTNLGDRAKTRDHLLLSSIKIKKFPEKQEEIVRNAVIRSEDSPEEKARWLLEHDTTGYLDQLSDEEARKSEALYLAKLQKLIDDKKYKQAEEYSQSPHGSVNRSFVIGLQALLASINGEETASVVSTKRALEEARVSENYIEFVALFALARKFSNEAMMRKAAVALTNMPSRYLPAGDRMEFLNTYFAEDGEFLYDLYERLSAARPKDPLVRFRKSLLDLIVKNEQTVAEERLKKLVEEYPDNLVFRCAYALTLAKQDNNAAIEYLSPQNIDWSTASNTFELSVYAALSYAEDKENYITKQISNKVVWDKLPRYYVDYLEQNQMKAIR